MPPAADGGVVADGGPAGDGGAPVCEPGTNKRRLGIIKVVNGTREPTYVPLDAAQQMAVVGLGYGEPRGASCSGVLIADRVVLTAGHCIGGEQPSSIYALFGMDDNNPVLAVPGAQTREHPTWDIGIIVLSRAPAESIDVRPIPIALEDLSPADIGITLEQAGYGQTSARGGSDGRFFVAEPLVGFDDTENTLIVDGQGTRGVCFGDSGGPSLRIAPAGDARVVGVLNWGDDSCVGRDRYARVDTVRAWIEETTGPTPGAGPQPCGSLVTVEGRCNETGTQAIYCQDGIQQHVLCPAGQSCAWSPEASGYRCVDSARDPCGGITRYGRCDGEILRWCDRDVVRERNCMACGERCLVVDATVGYACVASNCGDLTYEGRCQGTVVEWCDDDTGQRRTLDCATRNQTCGYVNPQLGYFCMSPECAELGYLGRCDGSVAVWCEDGFVRRRDCARRGLVCRYVDDQVGYTCTNP